MKMQDRQSQSTSTPNKISEALRAIINGSVADQLRARTVAEQIAGRLVQQALKGDFEAIKEILNRTEGRVPQASPPEDPEDKLTVIVEDVLCAQCSAPISYTDSVSIRDERRANNESGKQISNNLRMDLARAKWIKDSES